ncbi:MAG: gamma-glutamyl-gamma-aminobutyrate hydrolase family protein [Archangium sp.]
MKHHGSPRRPSIAVTPDITTPTPEAPFPKYDLKAAYTDAILRAGGLPFVLPYSDEPGVVDQYLDRVSGLVITGGAFDIPPSAYGEPDKENLGVLKPGRTNFEMAVLKAALQRKLPVLGVCGGMQLLNVAFGGTLIQDIGTELPNAKPHEQKHDRTQPQHPIDIKDHTLLAECVGGKGQLMVNSTHHQAVKGVGNGLIVSGVSMPDGVVEAIESTDKSHFVLGVQWHPELMSDTVPPNLGIYRAFVARARERRH